VSHSNNSTDVTPAATPAAWPRPTLVALPALRDLTLQSGVAGNITSAGGTSSGLSFLP